MRAGRKTVTESVETTGRRPSPSTDVIEVMDSTLRDGEQMQDGSFTSEEKLSITRMLIEEVGVNRVEIASARVSEGESQAVEGTIRWAGERGHLDRIEVLGFTDIKTSVDWIAAHGARIMNLLVKGSLKHLANQLRQTPEQHLKRIHQTADHAASKGVRVNVYLEDWSNGILESPDYVHALLDGMKDLPIGRFMLPDTLGILCPDQVTRLITDTVERYPELTFDFHGHNDYGLATANTVAAVRAGVSGIHATVNGVGERAGNTPLDEAVVCIHDFLGRKTTIDEKRLTAISETVEIFSGRRVAVNKPISGINVFTHTAGIHADGDKKANLYANRLLPERFDRKRRYALGKLSGKSNLEYNLNEMEIEITDEQKRLVLERIISLGDRKQTITQEDLPYIVSDVLETPQDRSFVIQSCVVVSSLGLKPMATVKLGYREKDSQEYEEHEESAQGDGGYDAIMNAIRKIARRLRFKFPILADYQVSIPSGGMSDALVQCSITWKADTTFVTKGVNPDQVMAAAEATEKMLNIVALRRRRGSSAQS